MFQAWETKRAKAQLGLALLVVTLFSLASAQEDVAPRETALKGTVLERQRFAGGAEPLHYTIYLPEGYARDTRSYPVVYLLHTYLGTDTDWVRYGGAADVADELIATNQIAPMILVTPDAKNSWYVDSPDYGRYETAFLDLVDHIDLTYRTIPERGSRAVAGASMGGYGAARFAVKYPGRFSAAAVINGAVFAEIAESAFFAYEPVFGRSFDRDRYQRERPETLLARWTPGTERPAFYLSVGDDDTTTPFADTVRLHNALLRAEAESQLRIADGGHTWPVFENAFDDALVFFAAEFERYSVAPVRPPAVRP